MDVIKTIIPAGGLGSRFLPLTKSVPKEMLPLINKPAIQYIIEEGVLSGISHFTVVTNKEKQALTHHFDHSPHLSMLLKERNQHELLASLEHITKTAHFTYVRQPEPLGLGHAIWTARHTIGKEYFGIILPDDILVSKTPGLAQLIKIARQEKASVIAVQEVPAECVSSYGVIAIKKQLTPSLFQVSHVVEKPSQKDAPSNFAVIGRYVLSPKIFDSLKEISSYAVGELQLTDGISHMMRNNEKVFAYKVQGTRYDIGTPIGWLKAIISMGLQHPEYGPKLTKFLENHDSIESFKYNPAKNLMHL